jgi:hypothetical protein
VCTEYSFEDYYRNENDLAVVPTKYHMKYHYNFSKSIFRASDIPMREVDINNNLYFDANKNSGFLFFIAVDITKVALDEPFAFQYSWFVYLSYNMLLVH